MNDLINMRVIYVYLSCRIKLVIVLILSQPLYCNFSKISYSVQGNSLGINTLNQSRRMSYSVDSSNELLCKIL